MKPILFNTDMVRGLGWMGNPWVWVIEFERISREETTP